MNLKILGHFLGFSKFAWAPPECRNFGGSEHVSSVLSGKCATAIKLS